MPIVSTELELPLPDEPHLDAWRAYATEAGQLGALAALSTKLVQLSFPVEAGISQTPAYQAATKRGVLPKVLLPKVPGTSHEVPGTSRWSPREAFQQPLTVRLSIAETLAGGLPVLHAPHRRDFETLVHMLTARNEPIPVPSSMSACLVSGLNNWHRIGLLRRRWEANRTDADGRTWEESFRALRVQKELYQDRLVLLGEGPYSAVPATELGFEEDEWRTLSAHIRLAHESAHYLTWRVHGPATDPWLEEVLADFVALMTVFGTYREEWALRFLGLDETGYHQLGGRLENYRGSPPLSDDAFRALGLTVAAAVCHLARWARSPAAGPGNPETLARPVTLARTVLHLRAGTLEDLAAGRGLPEAQPSWKDDGALHG